MGVLRSAAHRRAESRFWGVFIIAVHRAFVLGLGARHRGIVELSERIDVCDSVRLLYLLTYLREWRALLGPRPLSASPGALMLRRGRPTSDPHGMGGVWVGGGRRETYRPSGSHVAPKGSGSSTVAG